MRKIISCAVFKPYIEEIQTQTKQDFDVTYLDVKQHNYPTYLAKLLQEEIDRTTKVDEILLLYGLCGNAILPIKASNVKITILRVHDCLSVLLGSGERFVSLFSHRLSRGWSCLAYDMKEDTKFNTTSIEYQKYVEEYGEDNAMYIMEQMYPQQEEPLIYIDCNLIEDKKRIAAYTQPLEIIKGDTSYLYKVLMHDYDEGVVKLQTGERIKPDYDLINVFHTEKIK